MTIWELKLQLDKFLASPTADYADTPVMIRVPNGWNPVDFVHLDRSAAPGDFLVLDSLHP